MSATVLYMSMSLDGFIAGPNETVDNGLGDGGNRLHEWALTDPQGVNRQVVDEFMSTGAVVAGRGTVEPAGYWGGDHHDGVPIFIVTRQEPEASPWPLVSYVSDVTTAMAEAKQAAGDKDVLVHGAGIAQLALAAGVLDELELHVVPVLFGQGRRLFENLGARADRARAHPRPRGGRRDPHALPGQALTPAGHVPSAPSGRARGAGPGRGRPEPARGGPQLEVQVAALGVAGLPHAADALARADLLSPFDGVGMQQVEIRLLPPVGGLRHHVVALVAFGRHLDDLPARAATTGVPHPAKMSCPWCPRPPPKPLTGVPMSWRPRTGNALSSAVDSRFARPRTFSGSVRARAGGPSMTHGVETRCGTTGAPSVTTCVPALCGNASMPSAAARPAIRRCVALLVGMRTSRVVPTG